MGFLWLKSGYYSGRFCIPDVEWPLSQMIAKSGKEAQAQIRARSRSGKHLGGWPFQIWARYGASNNQTLTGGKPDAFCYLGRV